MRHADIRPHHVKVLELVEEGILDPKTVMEALLAWVTDQEVKDCMIVNDLAFVDDGEEYADEDHDGQPDEAQEWYDFDPDC